MEEGIHPDPFRTRKLSPPSPMVLRRKAVGEQDTAGLIKGLFFYGWDVPILGFGFRADCRVENQTNHGF